MEGLIVFRIASLTSQSVTNTGLPRARMLIRRKTGLTVLKNRVFLKTAGRLLQSLTSVSARK